MLLVWSSRVCPCWLLPRFLREFFRNLRKNCVRENNDLERAAVWWYVRTQVFIILTKVIKLQYSRSKSAWTCRLQLIKCFGHYQNRRIVKVRWWVSGRASDHKWFSKQLFQTWLAHEQKLITIKAFCKTPQSCDWAVVKFHTGYWNFVKLWEAVVKVLQIIHETGSKLFMKLHDNY